MIAIVSRFSPCHYVICLKYFLREFKKIGDGKMKQLGNKVHIQGMEVYWLTKCMNTKPKHKWVCFTQPSLRK